MNKTTALVMAALCSVLTACEATPDSTPTSSPAAGDGSQSAATLAGTYQACSVLGSVGSVFTGKGITKLLTLNSNGTYTYSVYFTDHVGCATSTTAGGNNIATTSQSGTFALGGIATTPSDATKITFTSLANSMTMYAASDGGSFATWMNGCAPNPGYSTTLTQSKSISGLACFANASYSLGSPPTNSASVSNIIKKTGTSIQMGARQDSWSIGSGSFPTTYTETY